ncbi:aminoglycoside phosphotransferase family protein [Roseibium algae]|uniref:Aminoglycoside phosphotransferase family protein n=1 Tax=Roseibium algae TaxID=3123038 RepID=A0ABU8TNH7_9HYPH
MTRLPKSIQENLHFLSAEIDGQLGNLEAFFKVPTVATARRILDRAGYALNLKSRIHSACATRLVGKKSSSRDYIALRSLEFIATDLQQLASLARQCIAHAESMEQFDMLMPERYPAIIARVRAGIQKIEPAFLSGDSAQAVEIGQLNRKIHADYKKLFKLYAAEMRVSKRTEDLAHSLLIANEIQRMGTSLQTISEALISANIGQAVNFERYFALQGLMSDLEGEGNGVHIESIAETRSGSSISAISNCGPQGLTAVLKDGEKSKVKGEREGVNSWHSIYPGLAPKILSYEKRNRSAAMLIEHLPGLTFENIVLNEDDALCDQALKQLGKTLKDVWRQTKTVEPAEMGSMQQLAKRLDDVYRVHPEFRDIRSTLAGITIPPFAELIEQAAIREPTVAAQFSVYIHGDFNVDNIIYDPGENRINFIDLHRSRYMDYVQDISVFMVSNYRLQVLDAPVRKKIMTMSGEFYKIARSFARKQQDTTFDYRMSLGLARSFASSTRFIFDKSHARKMFLRSRFLIERALACKPGQEHKFKLPVKEIFVD